MTKHHHHSSTSSSTSCTSTCASTADHIKLIGTHKHKIQFQLFDGLTYPVSGTEFWVTIKITKVGDTVVLSLPTINFQTGPVTGDPDGAFAFPGGTLRTSDGFLPEDLRPSDPVYRSYLGASNNGQTLPFSYFTPIDELPVPIAGYIISITIAGAIIIQGAGKFGAVIPPGAQTLMPTNVTYTLDHTEKLKENFIIDSGVINVTQFTGGPHGAAGGGFRDTHINDAFDGIVAWTWASNANVPDKVDGTMNVWVRVGKIKGGKLKMKEPIQLSDFGPNMQCFDTAVVINRTDKKNLVVSYALFNIVTGVQNNYRAVSFDGGKTWPISLNGSTNIQPTGPLGSGDNPGVATDKFGNIWYLTTNLIDPTGTYFLDQPALWISIDKGVTFSLVYTAPTPINLGIDSYDFDELCFGGDGLGHYGMWISADYFLLGVDVIPFVAFIPITGLGAYGTGTSQFLYSFSNTQFISNVTASEDGRVWFQSYSFNEQDVEPIAVRFKSPGSIDENYAGPWQQTISVIETGADSPTPALSFPVFGYFNSVQTIIYDEKRKALYSVIAQQAPDYSQSMRIFLIISRNNGQSWSEPFYVSNSNFANRGFPSMALDTKTGDLVFGWYDGRNDKTMKSVQYFGAVIPSRRLDKMVEEISLSNPLYTIAGPQVAQSSVVSEKRSAKVTNPRIRLRRECLMKRTNLK